jgi:hypothetical protein
MHKHHLHHAPYFFCFDELPADVQLLVLSNTDLQTLLNLTIALPSALELYLKCPSSILRGTLASLEPQIRNLLLVTFSLTYTIKYPGIYPKPDLENMADFLAQHLDTVGPKTIENLEHDPLGALHMLSEINEDITGLVHDYAQSIYKTVHQYLNPEESDREKEPPLLLLSPIESHRITLAIHRLKLFCLVFHNTPPPANLNQTIPFIHNPFFHRLHAFEIDELVSVYHFVYLDRRYLKFIHPGLTCTCAHQGPWESANLWNHQQGKCELYGGRTGIKWRRAFKSSEAFWATLLRQDFLHVRGQWARVDVCGRNTPVARKNGLVEGPSEGWGRWSKIRDEQSVKPHYYARLFGDLGYCFWDDERVKGWGRIWTKEWYRKEVESSERRHMAEQYHMLLPGGHLWTQLKERERSGRALD